MFLTSGYNGGNITPVESKQLRIGRAGEHLAMYDLLSRGYKCFMTEQGINYDIVVDLGHRLLRIQVKTTQKPGRMNQEYQNPTYLFHVRRAGRGGRREYDVSEFDGFALVAMDIRGVFWYPFDEFTKKTLIFRVPGIRYAHTSAKTSPYITELTSDRFFSRFSEGAVVPQVRDQFAFPDPVPRHAPINVAVCVCERFMHDPVSDSALCFLCGKPEDTDAFDINPQLVATEAAS